METEEALVKAGLDKKEAKIYLAVLALGESTVLPIARKSGISRTYCYDLLENLTNKGIITHQEIRGRERFSAVEPKMVEKVLTDRIKELKAIMPSLESLYQSSPVRPKVRFFQGKEGIEIIFNEIINEAKEVRYWSSISDLASAFPNYIEVIKRQVAKGIKIRDLVRRSKEALAYRHLYKKDKQEMRFLPEKAVFKTDNMVFNNKTILVSYGADLYAVSIESAEIAETMRVLFDILWENAQK